MIALRPLAILLLLSAGPAAAQATHDGHDGAATAQAADAPAPDDGPPAVPDHETAPPPTPSDHFADQTYDPAAMAQARATLREEHGGAQVSEVMVNLLEYRSRDDGYLWNAQAWFGGDLNRFVLKTEGEGDRRGLDNGEVEGLYSRAIGRYTDLQVGVRQDFGRGADRTYAAVGLQTLLPLWFETEADVFLSDRGEALARLEGLYDLRLLQRLVLQPRAELNFAAQDTAATLTGSGLSDGEFGLRLRYEITPEFAPYIGVSYERRFGRTADFARAAGEDVGGPSVVAGLRTWF